MRIRNLRGAAARWFATAAAISLVLCACSPNAAGAGGSGGKQLQVVAAENFWGSLVSQVGGSHVAVTSLVTDPNADPHEYESSTNDARLFATADYVVVNGAGYDDWARKLLDANPSSSRVVLSAADLFGKHPGDNPHLWYSPAYVRSMIDRITSDLQRIDPGDSGQYASQRTALMRAVTPYEDKLTSIKRQFHGVKVAATEDLVVYLVQALGLELISPSSFMRAVAQGNDPSAADVIAFQRQLTAREASVLLYNTQTVTAVTTGMVDLARRSGVEVVGLSETLQPATATFQDWQVRQLTQVQSALAAAGSASEQ